MARRADDLPRQRPLDRVLPRREARALRIQRARLDRRVPHLAARSQEAPGGWAGFIRGLFDRRRAVLQPGAEGCSAPGEGALCDRHGAQAAAARRGPGSYLRQNPGSHRRSSPCALQHLVRALPALGARRRHACEFPRPDRLPAAGRGDGLRCPLSPAGASDRHDRAQGQEQRAQGRARRCRQPMGHRR